jgi:hypothetical protein
MRIHWHGHSSRGARLRLLSFVLFAAGSGVLGFPQTAPAQVTFTSQASVSYSVTGKTLQSGFPNVFYSEAQTLTTNNPFAQPVQISKSIGGTLGSGGSSSSMFANVTAVGGAGLMRATIDGSTSAAWKQNQTSVGDLSSSSATVSWTDAYILTGNPANPQPGRPLVVQAFLNVTGNMRYTLTDPALEFGFNPGYSVVGMSLHLSARDEFGRTLIAGNQFGDERGATRTDLQDTVHKSPPGTVPVQMTVIEGQPSRMRFEMQVRASAQSSTGTQYFGPDSTATTFSADFGHTITWGGITAVTDVATGQPVSGWSITSASGVDYANPVPEPGSAATLLALAAPALLARRSRPRHHRA